MSIDEAAAVALIYWERDEAIVMTAIAGPESSYNSQARGDPLSSFSPARQVLYDPYDCDGYLSFGYWQIFQGVHYGKLEALTGSSDPCDWRKAMFVPALNGSIARQIWESQGYGAWTAYNIGAHKAYLEAAERAIDKVLGEIPPAASPLPAPVAPPLVAVTPPSAAVAPPASL